MIPINLIPYAFFFILIIGFLALTLKIVTEYQRLVVFFLARVS
jgi:hypothetical protein